jgi:hypothetical protein
MYPNQQDKILEERTTKAIAIFDKLWARSHNRSHFYLLVCDVMFKKFDQHQDEIRSLRKEVKELKQKSSQPSLF